MVRWYDSGSLELEIQKQHCNIFHDWVTVPRTRDMYIRRRRVPLSEIYYSMSKVFCIAYTDETERLDTKVVPGHWGVGVGGNGPLPAS